MFVAVQRDAFPNDEGAIVDRLCHRQDLEVTVGQVAKQIEIVHLPLDVKEGMFGVVSGGGRPDDHAGGIEVLLPGDAGGAGGSTECSQVRKVVAQLRFGARKCREQEEERCNVDVVFSFHRGRARGRRPFY